MREDMSALVTARRREGTRGTWREDAGIRADMKVLGALEKGEEGGHEGEY